MRLAYYRQRDGIVKSVPGLIRRCYRVPPRLRQGREDR